MHNIFNMQEYCKLKKQADKEIKGIKAAKYAEEKKNERFKKMLVKYFDRKGKGLSKSEIMEINEYLKNYVVLSNEKEISNVTTLISTYMTIAKKRLAEMRTEIIERLDNGEIIDKSDAVMATDNIIINKPRIERYTIVNGVKQPTTVVEGKKYVITMNHKTQTFLTRKYEQESTDGMKNIDSQIRKFENVSTLAYSGYADSMNF